MSQQPIRDLCVPEPWQSVIAARDERMAQLEQQVMAWENREAEEVIKGLREQVSAFSAAVESLLTDKPLPDGTWPHLLHCSGDRKAKPGTRGVSCCCKPVLSERVSALEQQLARMSQPVSMEEIPVGTCPWCGRVPEYVFHRRDGHRYACANGQCRVAPCTANFLTKADAIAAWNDRKEAH